MPQALLHPGVYIEEVPSGVRTITGVATSVAAFIGYTARGPVNSAVQIFSFADFERQFGGLHLDSPLSYAVSHFYMNGGGTAWIVRVAKNAAKASVQILHGTTPVIDATALTEGGWGNALTVTIDYDTVSPSSLFNLNVAEIREKNGVRQVVRSETHRNLSMNSFAGNYAVDVVKAASDLIRLERLASAAVPNTTKGEALNGPIAANPAALIGANARQLAIAINGGKTYEFDFVGSGLGLAGGASNFGTDMDKIAKAIQDAVRNLESGPEFLGFTCTAVTGTGTNATSTLTATSGEGGEKSSVSISKAGLLDAAGILMFGTANGGRELPAVNSIRPDQSGTAWLRQPQPFDFTSLKVTASVDVDLVGPGGPIGTTTNVSLWGSSKPTNLEGVRAALQAALNSDARPAFKDARVVIVGEQIVAIPGGDDPTIAFDFKPGPKYGGTASPPDLTTGQAPNFAAYKLGSSATLLSQKAGAAGNDGAPPGDPELQGSQAAKTGLYALEDVDLFNILMLPDQSSPTLQAEAVAYAKKRRAFVLLDIGLTDDTLAEAKAWITGASTPHDENAAAYFPRIRLADPLRDNRIRSFSNVGAIAGLYARTDAERGVWKAPAGTAAKLVGVQGLDYTLTDAENGAINPLGLNAIRTFPVYGNIAWGARTTVGADAQASEWKYVPIRRLALFLEESLYRGTQWVVFEPNDEPLWAQIRLNIGAFLNGLFRQGAFQGKTPKEAYFVKCDRETTTQADINLGIVNILVGFAPLKPAEFVVIKIQQMAGDIPT